LSLEGLVLTYLGGDEIKCSFVSLDIVYLVGNQVQLHGIFYALN